MNKNTFEDFEKDMLNLITELENGKIVKKFLRTEGNKLKKKTKALGRQRVKKRTGAYLRSIRRGKVFKSSKTDDMVVRVYHKNVSKTAKEAIKYNSLEYGRVNKVNGRETFIKGKRVMRDSATNFAEEYYSDTSNFIEEVSKTHGF